MKNKIIWHQIVLIVMILILSVWKIFTGRMFLGIDMVWWWLGSVAGFAVVFADRLAYVLLMRDEPLSVKFGEMFGKGKYIQSAEALVNERYEQKELVMRSALFIMAWAVVALFAASSVSNSFARGLVLGIGIHLLFDLLADYLWNKERLSLWFWQVKRELPENEKSVFVGVITVVYLFLGFIL